MIFEHFKCLLSYIENEEDRYLDYLFSLIKSLKDQILKLEKLIQEIEEEICHVGKQ